MEFFGGLFFVVGLIVSGNSTLPSYPIRIELNILNAKVFEKESKKIDERFPAGSQLIVSVSAPDISSERYLERLDQLTVDILLGVR